MATGTNRCVLFVFAMFVLGLLLTLVYHQNGSLLACRGGSPSETLELARSLKKSRDTLAVLLNEQRKLLGQQECMNSRGRTNSNGAWCRNTSKEDGGDHMTDMPLVAALSSFLKGKRVGSFGDGPGAYKREILKTGLVSVYDAFDGAPFCEETSEGRVTFMDLTVPQYGVPVYDWIISLEVAEHIPAKYESVYIDNIVRHAREGIILSWAVPGQGGLAHINNKPLQYVLNLMKSHGFEHDVAASKKIQKSASFQWLRQNTNVFIRSTGLTANDFELWHS